MEGSELVSKREQRKLDQAIKLINSMEAQEAKHQAEEAIEPKPRKKRKVSTHISINGQPPAKAAGRPEEPDQAAETKSVCHLTPQHQKIDNLKERQASQSSQHQEKDHLNPAYPVPDGDVSSYLICYQYSEQQKLMDKESSDYSTLDLLGSPLETVSHPKTLSLVKKMMEALKQHRQVIGGNPFSRQHLALGEKLAILES